MDAEPATLNARSLSKLGTAVKTLRLRNHWSQNDLAQAAKVSRQWVIALEKGQTPGLEVGRLMRVLDVLDASLTVRVDNLTVGE